METKKFCSGILTGICLVMLLWTTPAGAASNPGTITATISGAITADNAFLLFYGDATGDNLSAETLIASGYDWPVPQIVENYTIPVGSYLYVVAWNFSIPEPTNPQAWLGEFTLPGGEKLYSNLSDWVYKRTTTGGLVPSIEQLKTLVRTGDWNFAEVKEGNSTTDHNMSLNGALNIWLSSNSGNPIPGISTTEAYWIWWDQFANSDIQDGYVVFRSLRSVAPVPIPGSVLLVGTGLLGLWVVGRKRRQP